MVLTILGIIIGVILVLAAVVLIRTAMFKPYPVGEKAESPVEVDEEKIVRDMVDLIRCKTVSNRDESLVDRKEFEKLTKLVEERFPRVHAQCSPEKIGKTGLLFTWKGKSTEKPTVCMAHYDVVPVDESGWSQPPFEGLIIDGEIWGRGTMDTKGTFCSILEAAEQLLGEGYVPDNDLYMAFSGEEEIDGGTCPDIVAELERRGVKPAIVLDEGGAVVDHSFPGVDAEFACVGIGEKGSLNIDFEIDGNGGHASAPPVHTQVGELAQAAVAIEKHPFHFQYTKPVVEMFDILGRHSTFLYRTIFANMWLFRGALEAMCSKTGGEINAMLRTTCALTRIEGSKAYNVLPNHATMGANVRLMGTDTVENSVEYLNKVIDNPNIRINVVNGMNPSIFSDTSCEEWKKLGEVISDTWEDVIVTPYLMMACSDSRHYCRITDRVYRFSAMKMSKEERGMIHGNDERIPIPTLIKTVQFYVRFMKRF
ncbi:M20/M25/M40 family metallo-hydrolase [Hespellia stercorisuis]|uniref:Carboxypeptidase PM20D1 n=1 Tax=Hespellia stercorisuis DSM 15480 TaxID=1121950 RepID=A0A1M6SJH7_9FIRM|nr:M20/M25/M40 family metallo-hydrolase [Hespellia stercorisuis]SHK44891.1 carboxypeptidase PM20D1 [Hespellia stercorisuis DSM 15480]